MTSWADLGAELGQWAAEGREATLWWRDDDAIEPTPALDRMIDRQRTIFDQPQRKAAVREALTYMIDRAPYSSWTGRYVLNATQPDVRGWNPEGESFGFGFQFETVWLDA